MPKPKRQTIKLVTPAYAKSLMFRFHLFPVNRLTCQWPRVVEGTVPSQVSLSSRIPFARPKMLLWRIAPHPLSPQLLFAFLPSIVLLTSPGPRASCDYVLALLDFPRHP